MLPLPRQQPQQRHAAASAAQQQLPWHCPPLGHPNQQQQRCPRARGPTPVQGFKAATERLLSQLQQTGSPAPPASAAPHQQQQVSAQLRGLLRWPGSDARGSGSDSAVGSAGSTSSSTSSSSSQESQDGGGGGPQGPDADAAASNASSYAALLVVSLLWGSYAPALRYLYSMDALLTPQVLTAHRAVISAGALLAASAATLCYDRFQQHQQRRQQLREQAEQQLQQQLQREREEAERRRWLGLLPALMLNIANPFVGASTTTSSRAGGGSGAQQLQQRWLQPFAGVFAGNRSMAIVLDFFSRIRSSPADSSPAASLQEEDDGQGADSSSSRTARSDAAAAVLLAGLELGTWNFLATAAQACGLELSTATKAAFLTQTTAVFTPCLAVLCGQAVAPAHWLACLAALLGSCCITFDAVAPAGDDGTMQQKYVVAAAAPAATAQQQQQLAGTLEQLAAPPLQADEDGGGAMQLAADGNPLMLPGVVGATAAGSADGAACVDADSWCSSQAAAPDGSLDGITPAASAAATGTSAVLPAPELPSLQAAAAPALVVGSSSPEQPSVDTFSPASSLDQQPAAATTAAWQEQAASPPQASASTAPLSATAAPAGDEEAAAAVVATDAQAGGGFELRGEVYILLACCCYAIATVRLSMLAPGLDPVQLATSKTLTLAAASLFWLVVFGPGTSVLAAGTAAATDAAADVSASSSAPAAAEAAAEAAAGVTAAAAAAAAPLQQLEGAVAAASASWELPPVFSHGQGLLLLCYSALGPGALATVLQTKGQSTVAAAQAQVFYSLTPVWAALLAGTWLEGEEMGPLAWLGGGIILAASIGAAFSGSGSSGGGNGGSAEGTASAAADASLSGQ